MQKQLPRMVLGMTIALTASHIAVGQAKQYQLEAVQGLRRNIAEEVAKASVQVQQQVAKIPDAAPPPVNTPDQPAPAVSPADKAALFGRISDFQTYAADEKTTFSRLATGSLIAAAALGLLGSIASFLSWSKLGGIASLVAVAVIGFFNAYPVAPLADFYRSLSTQATALQVDCDLKEPFTLEAYNSAAAQLKLLYVFEGDKRPKWGSPETVSQDLAGQLQALRTTSNRLEAKAN